MNLAKLDSLFNNKTFTTVVSLTLALYAGLAAPALPDSIVYFFDTIVGKLLFLFLIGFVASRNVQVALMIALAFLVTLYVANKRATEHYIKHGIFENRSLNRFNAEVYLNSYPDLLAVYNSDLVGVTRHYIEHGYYEGRTLIS